MGQQSKRDAAHVRERLEYTLIQLKNTLDEARYVNDAELQSLIETAVDSTAAAHTYLNTKLGTV